MILAQNNKSINK